MDGTRSRFRSDVRIGEGRIRTQPGKLSLAGDSRWVGRDSSDLVAREPRRQKLVSVAKGI